MIVAALIASNVLLLLTAYIFFKIGYKTGKGEKIEIMPKLREMLPKTKKREEYIPFTKERFYPEYEKRMTKKANEDIDKFLRGEI